MIDEIHKLLIRAAAFKEASNIVKSYYAVSGMTLPSHSSANAACPAYELFWNHAELCEKEAKMLMSYKGDSYGAP